MSDLSSSVLNSAIANVWPNKEADRGATFKATRITGVNGAIGQIDFSNMTLAAGLSVTTSSYLDVLPLPDNVTLFTVLEFGLIPMNLMGITTTPIWWTPIANISSKYAMLILGICDGRYITLNGTYMMINNSGNMYVAISYAICPFVSQNVDDIYYKFYINQAYANEVLSNVTIGTTNSYINVTNDYTGYTAFATAYNLLVSTLTIPPMVFINGYYRPDGLPPQVNLSSGDVVDYVSDPYFTDYLTFNESSLVSYTSSIDNNAKLILSFNALIQLIYVTELECFISGTTKTGNHIGLYYIVKSPASLRMLTYKDFGIDATSVSALITQLMVGSGNVTPLTNITIHLYRRSTGQSKQDILDSNYISDLMNVNTSVRVGALAGVNATIPFWQAPILEQCNYIKWLFLKYTQLNDSSLMGIFSRYGLIKFYEKVRFNTNAQAWQLPANASNGGMLQSYVGSGGLVTFTDYASGNISSSTYSNGTGVELFYPGQNLQNPLDNVINSGDTSTPTINSDIGVFCYYLFGSVLTYAIEGTDYNLVTTNGVTTLVWNSNLIQYTRWYRTSEPVIYFKVALTYSLLTTGIDIYNGRSKANEIGMGTLMVWINLTDGSDRFLIEGLDYSVLNGMLYLTSKPVNWNPTGIVTIVYFGLPDPSLQHVNKNDWGWVKHGYIYENSVYDLFMNRNRLFFIDGRATPFEAVISPENYLDKTNLQPTIPTVDGTPYAVIKPNSFYNDDVLTSYSTSLAQEVENDTLIANYLSAMVPQVPSTTPIGITQKYELVSPLLNSVIDGVINNTININYSNYTADTLQASLESYMYLQPLDPCTLNHDANFTVISPRWSTDAVTVTNAQSIFINDVNILLLQGKVSDINHYLTISQ